MKTKKSLFYTVLAGVACAFAASSLMAKDLVWNGGAGASWTGSDKVWLDGETPSAWVEGSTAVFGGSGLVVVQDEFNASGIKFTSSGTTLIGPGLIRLSGAIDAAAGTENAIASRVYASPAMSKTGTGLVSLGYTRGAFSIDEGTVWAGGYNMHDTAVTIADGATLKTVTPEGRDKTANLIKNGSFETPERKSYAYIGSNGLSPWVRGAENYIVHSDANAQHSTWGNALSTVPDGNQIVAVQMSGSLTQTVTVPSDGFYDLSLYFFKRGNYNPHQIYIYLDDVLWQTFFDEIYSAKPMFTNTGAVYLKAGSHKVTIAGEGNWGDTTTFIDDVALVAPVTEVATAIPTGRGTVVDVASGERTFDDTYTLAVDANNSFAYFTKTGVGKAIFTKDISLPNKTLIDVEGEAVFEGGNVTGSQKLYKTGAGSLTVPQPSDCTYMIMNGSVKFKTFTGSANVHYMVSQNMTAGFYPGLGAGDVTMNSLSFSGGGTCLLGTLGDGRTLTVKNGGTMNAVGVRFDIGAGDTLKFGDLRAELVGNRSDYCDTDVIKLGPGAMELTALPSCYPPTTFTVREGALTVDFTDTIRTIAYTPMEGSAVSKQVPGLIRDAATPLVLGDFATPDDGAVAFYANCANFAMTRPITIGARGAAATLGVKSGVANFAGAVSLGRDLALSAAEGTTLAVGPIAATADTAPEVNLPATGKVYLNGDMTGLTLGTATGFLAAGYNAAAAVAVPNLAISGASELSFDVSGNDRFDVAGELTLGALEVSLRDDLTGEVFDVPGTYTLFTYGSLNGDATTLSVAAASQKDGYTYAFAAAGGKVTLTIAATADNNVLTWLGTAGGTWSQGPWSSASAPASAGETARFMNTIAADATIDVGDGATIPLKALVFESAKGYTLTNGTLRLTDGVTVVAGAQTIVTTLENAGATPVALTVADGAKLTLGGVLNGAFRVASGEVTIGETAVVNGSVTVASGAKLSRATLAATGSLAYEAVTGWGADQTAVYEAPATGRYYFKAYDSTTAFEVKIDGSVVLSGAKGANPRTWVTLAAGPHILSRTTAKTAISVMLPGETNTTALATSDLRQLRGPEALAGAGKAVAAAGATFAVSTTNTFGAPFSGALQGEATGAFVKTKASAFAAPVDGGALLVKAGTLSTRGTSSAARVAKGATLDIAGETTVGGLDGEGTVTLGSRVYAYGIDGDADCGISTDKVYTHKCSVTAENFNPPVNGVTFDVHKNVKNSNCTGIGLLGESGNPGVVPAEGEAGFAALVRKCGLGGKNNSLWIDGLTPGKTYDFRLYLRPFGDCDRKFIHSFYTGTKLVGSVTWDPFWSLRSGGSQSNAELKPYSVVGCRYVADAAGKLTMTAVKANMSDWNGFHWYAFTNEEVSEEMGETPLTVAPATGETAEFRGSVTGDRALAVAGDGTQIFGVGATIAAKTLKVENANVLLKSFAKSLAPAEIAAGKTLALWAEAQVGGIEGEGTVNLALAEEKLRDGVAADGSFPLANAGDTYPRQVFVDSDEASGISPHKTYTVVHSWGGNDIYPVVNDVAFTRGSSSVATNAQGVGVLMSGGGIYASTLYIPNTLGAYWLYAQNIANSYNAASGYLKATGLTPGVTYEARVYLASFGTGNNRKSMWYADEANAEGETNCIHVVQDVPNKAPFYVAVRYTATDASKTITWYRDDNPNVPHVQGFSNEIVEKNARYLCVSNACSFAGAVTGAGELEKTGPATQTFTGALDAKALWTVQEGVLEATNGDSKFAAVCVAGGEFRAVGTVTGDVGVMAGGALGVSGTGELKINGKCVVADGGALSYQVRGWTCRTNQCHWRFDIARQPDGQFFGRQVYRQADHPFCVGNADRRCIEVVACRFLAETQKRDAYQHGQRHCRDAQGVRGHPALIGGKGDQGV